MNLRSLLEFSSFLSEEPNKINGTMLCYNEKEKTFMKQKATMASIMWLPEEKEVKQRSSEFSV